MIVKFTAGSAKQRKWAQEIVDQVFGQLDSINNTIDRYIANGMTEYSSGFTYQQVAEMRKFFEFVFSQPLMQDAARIIEYRDSLHPTTIIRMVQDTLRADMRFDTTTGNWTKRTQRRNPLC